MKVQTLANTNVNELVQVNNEQVVTDSCKVAEVFGNGCIRGEAPNIILLWRAFSYRCRCAGKREEV